MILSGSCFSRNSTARTRKGVKGNATLFEKAFYSGKGSDSIEPPAETGSEAKAAPSGVDPDLLAKILSNPEMAALLTSLAKSLN